MSYGTPSTHQGVQTDETGYGNRRTTTIRFIDAVFDLADEAGVVGKIVPKIYDFPEGLIVWEGGVINLTQTRQAVDGDSAGLATLFDGDVGLGTAVGAGAALTTTEQDLIPTTSVPQAVAGVATAAAISTSTEAPKLFNGTGTPVDVYLNMLFDDADQDATGHPVQVVLNGTVKFNWTFLGDK